MIPLKRNSFQSPLRTLPALFLAAAALLFATTAVGDESDAKRILKAMSDYVGAQNSISFDYDSVLQVTTVEGQVIGLASSGTLKLHRPDKIHYTHSGGFVDAEVWFDGTTLTLLGKNINQYAQVEIPGTLDNLIDELKDTYQRPLPAADLLLSNSYDVLMKDVVDIKDLGSGVVGGMECDTFAFRTEEVDWQIWIAQGDKPYVCRFVITSKLIAGGPQYSVQVRDWKTPEFLGDTGFGFKNKTDAEQVDLDSFTGADSLPDNMTMVEGE